jgi:LAO/AO transport system kinase
MHSVEALVAGLRDGDRTALAKAITLVESTRAADSGLARELVERCLPWSGVGARIGITGIPGAGKSTLIDDLGLRLIARGHRVAVLAIDPSSARSGGSILGDKTRMERLAQRPEAFIRPTAAGGHLGGVARRSREAIVLCEAAGFDRVIVETVGTGQNELEADAITDASVLLMVAGTGDDLQGIKRGIMEAADLIAFTKCDGGMQERAAHARRELLSALQLMPARPSGKRADVLLTSATTGQGMEALTDALEALLQQARVSGVLEERRREQALAWLEHALADGLRTLFNQDASVAAALPGLRQAVREGGTSPFAAAETLLRLFRTGGAPLP